MCTTATSSGTLPLFAYCGATALAHTLAVAQQLPLAKLSKAAVGVTAAAATAALLAHVAVRRLPPAAPTRFWFKIGAIAGAPLAPAWIFHSGCGSSWLSGKGGAC